MGIYYATLASTFILSLLARMANDKKYKIIAIFWISLVVSVLVLFSGLRSGIGDTGMYKHTYGLLVENPNFSKANGDYGFVLLNLILIPKYGYMAAALVTTLTEVINLILMRAYIRKIVKFNDIKEVIILLIPSIVMGLILSITRIFISNIFVLILISIVIYFITLFTLKIVTINELKEGFKD